MSTDTNPTHDGFAAVFGAGRHGSSRAAAELGAIDASLRTSLERAARRQERADSADEVKAIFSLAGKYYHCWRSGDPRFRPFRTTRKIDGWFVSGVARKAGHLGWVADRDTLETHATRREADARASGLCEGLALASRPAA